MSATRKAPRKLGGKIVLALLGAAVLAALAVSLLSGPRLPLPSAGREGDGSVQQTAPVPGDEGSQPGAGDGNEMLVENFARPIRSEGQGEVEAMIRGDRAVRGDDQVYRIHAPEVESVVKELPSEDGQASGPAHVRLTAERAVFDERAAVVELEDSVRAVGDQFEILTDRVTYRVKERLVTSQSPVELRRFRRGPEGERVLAMSVTGSGLQVDLTLKRVVISQSPTARLFDLSKDFLASAVPLQAGEEPQELTITADRKMVYEHTSGAVSFAGNVVATCGERKLLADELTLVLGKGEGSARLEVTDIKADGEVELHFRDQVASGQHLEWQSVTQAGLLKGEPAELRTESFVIRGGRLTFFRLNSRFEVDGEGKLVWTPAPEVAADAQQTNPTAVAPTPASPVLLANDQPVDVSWQGGMSYDATERMASFTDGVRAVQGDVALDCQMLELRFEDAGRDLSEVLARGQVQVRQAVEGAERSMTSDRVRWDAGTGLVEMSASEGQEVRVVSDQGTLVSQQATFDPSRNAFACQQAGTLTLAGSPAEAGNDATQPIRARWQESMRYRGGEGRFAEFHGGVKVVRPGQVISAQDLRVDFDADMNPTRIEARGDAVLEVRRNQEEGEAPGAGEEGGGAAFGALGAGATQWVLRSDVIVGEPQSELLTCQAPGELRLLGQAGAEDTIRWSERMAADFAGRFAQFDGDVQASFSGTELECRSLRFEFDEGRKLRHVSAEGPLAFASGGESPWKLEAGSAEGVFAPGGVLAQVIARKDVTVRDAERTLRTKLLKLFFEPGEDGQGTTLVRAEASGEVRVKYGAQTNVSGSGDGLSWQVESDTYVLTGQPAVAQRGGVAVKGDRIVIERQSGVISIPRGEEPVSTTVSEPPQ